MIETEIQDKYLMNFISENAEGLNYTEVKANTVSPDYFILDDLLHVLRDTTENQKNYKKILRKNSGDEDKVLNLFREELTKRINESANMAIFFNNNKAIKFEGESINLFYPSGSVLSEDKLFEENKFSVVQELPYVYKQEGKKIFSFRPDVTFFLNGIFIGYCELKSNWNNQNAVRHGRDKVFKDYSNAVSEYVKIANGNDVSQTIRKNALKVFEKAIHITATDIDKVYIIRNLAKNFQSIRKDVEENNYTFGKSKEKFINDFKDYPVLNVAASKKARFEEVFRALYSKKMIEREILYYNFIERELVKKGKSKKKEYKHNDGRLISPRPKQKFGTDKILSRIDEFLEHEQEPDYFIKKLEKQLEGVGSELKNQLITARKKFQNNKNIYSLLMQYAAGFGKSNIIGWTALNLKDLRRDGSYIYDKVMLVVDRVQLRDQLDSLMYNMNINNKMYIEASSRIEFENALKSDTRIVVVNLQKFNNIKEVLTDDVVEKLKTLRIAFLIDEIHRSNNNTQHGDMVSLFDELQHSFDENEDYVKGKSKKNLIVGFTATPSDVTLSRFGEFKTFAENRPIWEPFDYYTMSEAITDGYILNPLKGVVPVSAKMFFQMPDNELEGFEGDVMYRALPDNISEGVDINGNKYRIRKKNIYQNEERIKSVAKFVVNRLVSNVYCQIRGKGKAMLAVSSIKAAITYKKYVEEFFAEIVQDKKYDRFKEAPIHIAYSKNQDYPSSNSLNDGMSEEKVLQNFAICKNGLMIVVDKLQTGFDEPKLHTMFLDKEISGINAIQTISRVNRRTDYKNDCKIVDFSYKNVNVESIKTAFEHFSNMVVSDFDPLGDEKLMMSLYEQLKENVVYRTNFKSFSTNSKGSKSVDIFMDIESDFDKYIRVNKDDAKILRKKIGQFFTILNLIEFVIAIDVKYSDGVYLDFWKRFNNIYRNLEGIKDVVDSVDIYFDNKIGIVNLKEQEEQKVRESSQGGVKAEGKQYKFDILAVIEKRNDEEEEIAELILEFEKKIESLFSFIKDSNKGIRLLAKIEHEAGAFDQEEIYGDFSFIYNVYIRKNRKFLGKFFIDETKTMTNQLCDDFERWNNRNRIVYSKVATVEKNGLFEYEPNDNLDIAAEK